MSKPLCMDLLQPRVWHLWVLPAGTPVAGRRAPQAAKGSAPCPSMQGCICRQTSPSF